MKIRREASHDMRILKHAEASGRTILCNNQRSIFSIGFGLKPIRPNIPYLVTFFPSPFHSCHDIDRYVATVK